MARLWTPEYIDTSLWLDAADTSTLVEDVRQVRLEIATPIEGQVTGADPATGSIPLWARIYTPADDWWTDVTALVEGGTGEAQLAATGTEGDPPVSVARLSSFMIAG